MNKPAPSQQFDPFCFAALDGVVPSVTPGQEEAQPLLAQGLENIAYGEDDLKQEDGEDGCVSLDQDTMSSILHSITECLGPHNVLQLFSSQDPNSNFMFEGGDPNLNFPDSAGQPAVNMSSFYDAHFNQMVSHSHSSESLPQDLLGISLGQVKTESEEDS